MDNDISMKKVFGIVAAVVLSLVALLSIGKLAENVDANEIMIVQAPLSGNLAFYTSAGLKPQLMGTITNYPKRDIYHFAVPVRFNDGGHGTMYGSIQYDLPLSDSLLRALHVRFGSREAIQQQVVQTVTNKSVYMTGPLMSSKESYAERRNDLIRFVEDQVQHGVYRTRSREQRVTDPISGSEKTVIVVDIVMGPNGQPERQEVSILDILGITTSNFSIDSLPYDSIVETQIKQQQVLAMQVQTSIAEARQSEQRVLTVGKNGEATAAEARWRQEAIRSESTVVAQRRLDMARLDAQAAAQERQANILRGEGEATRRRLVMQADGALQQKLEAMVRINQSYAENFAKYTGQWVPSVVMGDGGSGRPGSGAFDLMSMLTIQTARQLGLDLGVSRGTGGSSAPPPVASNRR